MKHLHIFSIRFFVIATQLLLALGFSASADSDNPDTRVRVMVQTFLESVDHQVDPKLFFEKDRAILLAARGISAVYEEGEVVERKAQDVYQSALGRELLWNDGKLQSGELTPAEMIYAAALFDQGELLDLAYEGFSVKNLETKNISLMMVIDEHPDFLDFAALIDLYMRTLKNGIYTQSFMFSHSLLSIVLRQWTNLILRLDRVYYEIDSVSKSRKFAQFQEKGAVSKVTTSSQVGMQIVELALKRMQKTGFVMPAPLLQAHSFLSSGAFLEQEKLDSLLGRETPQTDRPACDLLMEHTLLGGIETYVLWGSRIQTR